MSQKISQLARVIHHLNDRTGDDTNSPTGPAGDRSGDLADVEVTTLAALRRVAAAQDSAKKRGNQSFKAGRFDDAEKHYTAAIDAGFEPATAGLSSEDDVHSIAPASVHFAAVCLCNRAAAAQGGGAFQFRRLLAPTAHTA